MTSRTLEQELEFLTYATTFDKPLRNTFIRLVEKLFCAKGLRHRYIHFRDLLAEGEQVNTAAIKSLGIEVGVSRGRVESIPAAGSTIIVCNHPFGIVDGLAVASVVRAYRPDLKILAHQGICNLPQMSDYFLPVVFDLSKEAQRINVSSVMQFKDHVRSGGCGIVFPAGAVSTKKPLWSECADPDWQNSAAKWAKALKAQVVPIFIEGECGNFFHFVSQFSMTLRLSTLLYENCQKIDSTVHVRIGEAMSATELGQKHSLDEMTRIFRDATYQLKQL